MDFRNKVRVSNVQARQETAKALRCYFEDYDTTEWIPKSQIDDDSEVWQSEDYGTLIVSEWIAEQKGLL